MKQNNYLKARRESEYCPSWMKKFFAAQGSQNCRSAACSLLRHHWVSPGLLGVLASLLLLSSVISCNKKDGDKSPEDKLEGLIALPYLNYVDGEGKQTQVTMNEVSLTSSGLNLFKTPEAAILMDMQGKVLHTWKLPDSKCFGHVELAAEGHLVVQSQLPSSRDQKANDCRGPSSSLYKLDWSSNVVWEVKGRFHHDIDVLDDGTVYALDTRERKVRYEGHEIAILDNELVTLSPSGERLATVSIYDLFRRPMEIYHLKSVVARKKAGTYDAARYEPLDVFHVNSIEILRRDVDGLGRRGTALLSIPHLDLISVLSSDQPEILWQWGPGEIERQHHPSIASDGQILLFDNGNRRKWSRVIKLNPKEKKIVWQYPESKRKAFFSFAWGSVQELAGGNLLIAESAKGRAFEITPDRRLVWEYWRPLVKGKRPIIYRIARVQGDAEVAIRKRLPEDSPPPEDSATP